MDKCNHDILSEQHSVNLLPRRNMALPDMIYGICVVCHKPLTFIREHDTEDYVLKEVEEDEDAKSDV